MPLTLQTIEELKKEAERKLDNFENTINPKGAVAWTDLPLDTLVALLSAARWALENGWKGE